MRNKCGYDICCHPLHKEHIGCEPCHFWQQPILMDAIKTKQDEENEKKTQST